MEEFIEIFILILSTLVHRKTPLARHNSSLMQRTHLPGIEKVSFSNRDQPIDGGTIWI